MESYNNYNGFLDYSIPSSPFSTGSSTTSSTTSSTSGSGSKFDTAGAITTGAKIFGDIFSSTQNRKAQEAQAKALREQGLSQVEVAKIMQETERLKLEALKSGAGAGTKAGSPVLYIAVGVGAVIILGVVIFAVTRKK